MNVPPGLLWIPFGSHMFFWVDFCAGCHFVMTMYVLMTVIAFLFHDDARNVYTILCCNV